MNLRYTVPERQKAFTEGLARHGFSIAAGLTHCPGPQDILVTWNRIGAGEAAARSFEAQGRPVLVAENASWGNNFAGDRWYHIARGHHNTAGCFDVGGPERWDSLPETIHPLRYGGETVILPQRGIGSPPTAMPRAWVADVRRRYPQARVREHPGQRPCAPLWADLREAGDVVTWGSGAAILASLWGISVHSEMPGWIGEQDNSDEGRLAMFRRLAWAQWRMAEISSGEAFARLLGV